MENETTSPLLFAELPLEGRIAVLDTLLADLSADHVRAYVTDPALLGVVAEAHLGGLITQASLDAIKRSLTEDDYEELIALVNLALLARLPTPA